MKKLIVLAGFAVAAVSSLFAASGNCEKNAISLKSSQSVKLVAEYDPEDKSTSEDTGVAYYKIKLNRGTAATIWIQSSNYEDFSMEANTADSYEGNLDVSPSDAEEFDSLSVKAIFVESDAWDWDEDEKVESSLTLYIRIEGEIGDKTQLYYQSGIKSFVQTGEERSPKALTFKTTSQTVSGKTFADGDYWFKAKFTAGCKYVIATTSGNEENEFDFDFMDIPTTYDEADAAATTGNARYWFTIETTGTYSFKVEGPEATSFKVTYMQIPSRKPEKHEFTELNEGNGYAASGLAGRLNAGNDYCDNVADESLFRIKMAKGERRAFETVGAAGDIQMNVYDASGAILATNVTKGAESKDCRAAITASAAAWYYIGVYDPNRRDSDDDQATMYPFVINAIDCASQPPADAFDPLDDAISGATLLAAASAATNSDVVATAAAAGVASVGHVFDAGDWYDVYRIAARKGITYRLRATLDNPEEDEAAATGKTLKTKVFTLDSKNSEKTVTTTGSLFTTNDTTALTFKAGSDAVHYIRVQVAEGVGLDFPSHTISAIAYNANGTGLGMLQVWTKGAEKATWYIDGTKTSAYPSGAVVNVPAGTPTVVFNALTGFAKPANQKPAVSVGEKTAITGVYNDSYDKYTKTVNKKTVTVTDDNEDGAVSLAATATKTVSAPRTFWADGSSIDPEDNFTFTAADGTYYNFTLADTTLGHTGDAVFSITKNGETVVPATNSVLKRTFTAGKHILKVSHANPASPVDSSYALNYSTFNTGTVKFSAATYTAKESDGFATLKVQRTGKEGVVRVNWATQQTGEGATDAIPGKEYYPTNGVITWANGDKADKTIQVRLIPDLVAAVESNKSFKVKLWVMDEDDIADDEFPAIFTRDEATVTLSEVTAKGAGTITPTTYEYEGGDVAITNVKKPVVNVVAGKDATFRLKRSNYTALTKVAVKVTATTNKSNKDTAVKGTDYEAFSEIIEWDEGDDDEQEVSIPTMESSDLTLTKQFTVTIAAQTSGDYKGWDKPTLTATSVTVKIANSTAKESFATFAKTAATAGITAKATKGTWVLDVDGALRSKAAASAVTTLTVTGPGLFVADPEVVGDCSGGIYCKIGKGEEFITNGRFVELVPAGKQSIVFTLKGGTSGDAAVFNAIDDGNPFKWIPFSGVTPVTPANKAVVSTNEDARAWSGLSALSWSIPAGLDTENLLYRVRFGEAKNPTDVLTNATIDTSCPISAASLKAGTTYYWALDFAYPGETEGEVLDSLADPESLDWVSNSTVWTFSTAVDGASSTFFNGDDAFGRAIFNAMDNGEAIQLVQGVVFDMEIGPENMPASITNRLVAGSLPTGLKFDQRGGKGRIYGTPTKAGSFTALVQSAGSGTVKKPVWGTTLKLSFEVLPLGTAVGSYRGVLVEDGTANEAGAPRTGLVTFSATAAGALTAKVTVAGKSYSFSKTGFDEIVDYEGAPEETDVEPGEEEEDDDASDIVDSETTRTAPRLFEVTMTMTKTYSKVVYTNELVVTLFDGPTTNAASFVAGVSSVKLRLNIPNAKDTAVVTENATYTADLYRNNSTFSNAAARMKKFYSGYYTASLAAPGVTAEDGVPAGHGFITLKVTDAGAVTLAGRLADGTALSGSSVASLAFGDAEAAEVEGEFDDDAADPGDCVLYIPVAFTSSSYSFGGVARVVWADGDDGYAASILDSTSKFRWYKDGASATQSGEMLDLELEPAGGWFNTIPNLQSYYLDRDFSLDGVGVTLQSNTVKLGATKSDSASAITYSLARATGLVTGTLTYAGTTKIKHFGVLLMNRDAAGTALDEDVWTAGFFTHKVTSSWTESLPFDITATQIDRDWNEVDIPSAD